jgi:hypothetical protein
MSDKPDRLDRDLQSLFLERGRQLDAEPFLSLTLKRIEHHRSRRMAAELVLRVLGVAGIAALSPVLIRGSAWLSNVLRELFEFGGNFLDTPRGMFLAALVVLSILIVNARRIFQRL